LEGCQSKVRVSPSGVRPESFSKYDGNEFRRYHSIEGTPLVLFLGRLNPLKGPQFIIEAAPRLLKEFPGTAFVFVGPDQSGFGNRLQVRARELGVSAHVYFTGMIEDFEEKMQAYSACDVFCLPTCYEGTSQAVFEAMTQGKPVVATRTGGIPFQIEDGVEGHLIDYGDVSALAEMIAQTLRDTSRAGEMGARARERVMSFQYPNLAVGLQEIYKEIAEQVGN
jgi:glycosyltransferase involved in cell wall biosynthesis